MDAPQSGAVSQSVSAPHLFTGGGARATFAYHDADGVMWATGLFTEDWSQVKVSETGVALHGAQ